MTWPPPGRRLLPREAAEILYGVGWSDLFRLATMIAVAQQESQFYCEAVGPENQDGSFDFGWLQINSAHAATFGAASVEAFRVACFDPVKSARYARKLYTIDGFRPWVAYTSGAYKKHLGTAVVGVANFAAKQLELAPIPFVKEA